MHSLAFSTAIASQLFLSACFLGEDEVSSLKSDEEVVLFPSYAALSEEGERWRGTIDAIVYEPEEDDISRNALLGLLTEALDLDERAAAEALFVERARPFLFDRERGKRICLRARGEVFCGGPSGANGRVSVRVDLPLRGERPEERVVDARAVLREGDERRFTGRLHLVPPEGLSVVSDIDDTVKVSEVGDRRRLLARTFLEPYEAVPGMAAAFAKLRETGAVFHYVSNSPWQLHHLLHEFLVGAGFPQGVPHLRAFRWKDRTFREFLRGSSEHKRRTIETLLGEFPRRRFILVGDTAERDPEIYSDLARRHPEQVVRILLRDPAGGVEPRSRLEPLFEGIPEERWEVFVEPSAVEWAPPAEVMRVSRGYSIPLIDLAGEEHRQVVVDREKGRYLGHPSTALLEDGRTILAVYPAGHGRGEIILKRSVDGGRTWGERLPVPENWATSKETPTIHRVVDPAGVRRLILFSGLYPARMSVSEDDGETWTPLEPLGEWGGIVVMGSVVELKDVPGRYLAMFHDDGRFFREDGRRTGTFTVYKTFSADGGLTWSFPEKALATSEVHLCEPGVVRSPDGKQLAALLRENSRRRNSFVIFSDDEGATWSQPRELPGALTGDRHTARYAPDGRLFVSFRDTTHESPTRGDWVGWVGTYADIVHGREGQYRVRLMDNLEGRDCAYPGVEVLPDGTFVATTYGHWDEGEAPYIMCVRFRLEEIDRKAGAREAR